MLICIRKEGEFYGSIKILIVRYLVTKGSPEALHAMASGNHYAMIFKWFFVIALFCSLRGNHV